MQTDISLKDMPACTLIIYNRLNQFVKPRYGYISPKYILKHFEMCF